MRSKQNICVLTITQYMVNIGGNIYFSPVVAATICTNAVILCDTMTAVMI